PVVLDVFAELVCVDCVAWLDWLDWLALACWVSRSSRCEAARASDCCAVLSCCCAVSSESSAFSHAAVASGVDGAVVEVVVDVVVDESVLAVSVLDASAFGSVIDAQICCAEASAWSALARSASTCCWPETTACCAALIWLLPDGDDGVVDCGAGATG